MIERLVRLKVSDGEREMPPQPFSHYLDKPNIVLLGDPGAGKSFLFALAAKNAHAQFYRTRDFLNLDASSFGEQPTLFIDGLDEQRSGRSDQDVVNEIIKKLQALKPRQVRISCRAADWQSTSDLNAFNVYFSRTGGCSVLTLEPMSLAECTAVLRSRAHPDPEKFLHEAHARGLDRWTSNPQTLIMLADVVDAEGWPVGRSALYSKSVDLLLTERNESHLENLRSNYTAEELRDAAGGFCAGRLLADCSGISLKSLSQNADFPSYKQFPEADGAKLLAALGRRLFTSLPQPDTVDYCHRTVAEYLAATWLSTRILQHGLPLGRLLALICINGVPASELRGVYAWLPELLPHHAATLIAGDPYGVLAYGDATSLSPTARSILFSELVKLTDRDPQFRYNDYSSRTLVGLSGPDMEKPFKAVLTDKASSFYLRTLVLDALAVGTPMPSLQALLADIVPDAKATYRERSSSLDALIRMGVAGIDVAEASLQRVEASAEGIRLKAQGMVDIGAPRFGPRDVAALIVQAAECNEELIGGAFWKLEDAVSHDALEVTLNRLDAAIAELSPNQRVRGNEYEVIRVVDALLARRLRLEKQLPADDLQRWLQLRRRCARNMHSSLPGELHAALLANSGALRALVRHCVDRSPEMENEGELIEELRDLALSAVTGELLIEEIRSLIATASPERISFLYRLALSAALWSGVTAAKAYDELLEYAEGNNVLMEIRAQKIFSPFPAWRLSRSAKEREEAENRAAVRSAQRARFTSDIEAIRAGSHQQWMSSIGRNYFGLFSDLDRNQSPAERLCAVFGEDLAPIAIKGLIAMVVRQEIPPLQEIAEVYASTLGLYSWYALIAGLDEFHAAGRDVLSLPDDYLSSALALGRFLPTHSYQSGLNQQMPHAWVDRILEGRPELACEVYFTIANAELAKGGARNSALYALMDEEQFLSTRGELAIRLLQRHAAMPVRSLQALLKAAYHCGDHTQLLELINLHTIKKADGEKLSEIDITWTALAYMMDSEASKLQFATLDKDQRAALTWTIRDLGGICRRGNTQEESTYCRLIANVIRMVTGNLPLLDAEARSGVGWGDTNSWDARQWVMQMIGTLSSDTSSAATEALTSLSQDVSVSNFHVDIKRALAEQRRRLIDTSFSRPTLRQAFDTISNGPPANIVDLQMLVLDHIKDINNEMTGANTDSYKPFWNEGGEPKIEDTCRDHLISLLRTRLHQVKVQVEPEGHMRADKRADIVVTKDTMKLVIELKRDRHRDVWNAFRSQLDRLYTRDPGCLGYGMYGVFWFGPTQKGSVRAPPKPLKKPQSAIEMAMQMRSLVHEVNLPKIASFVLDVSAPNPTEKNEKPAPTPTKRIKNPVRRSR